MIEWITNTMNEWGYPALVFLMFLENVLPPIPSELIMPLGGFTARRGELSLVGVILAGTAGSVLGALPLYYLGKRIGHERLKEWADRHGKWLTLCGDDLEKARRWFDRHGGKAVLLCRLVPGIRSLISIPAGVAHMNLGVFLLYTTIGAGAWSAVLAWLGYLLGGNYAKVEKFLGPASWVILGGIVAWYLYRVIQQHRRGGLRCEPAAGV